MASKQQSCGRSKRRMETVHPEFNNPKDSTFKTTSHRDRCRGRRWRRGSKSAYSLLEVQVAMILLTAGLLGLAAMLRTHSRQMEVAESWCRDGIEYYIHSQSNTWMRRIGVPAELTTDPNSSVWKPPVQKVQSYEVELDSFVLDFETQSASARVKLKKVKK